MLTKVLHTRQNHYTQRPLAVVECELLILFITIIIEKVVDMIYNEKRNVESIYEYKRHITTINQW